MINEIKIYNRFNMDNFARVAGGQFPYKDQCWHLISIHGNENDPFLTGKNLTAMQDLGCRSALSLRFWDMTDVQAEAYLASDDPLTRAICDDMKLFSPGEAEEVLKFIRKANDDPDTSALVIHCEAGISRSGAVGVFAAEHLGLDFDKFLEDNSWLSPNALVLRLLRQASGMPDQLIKEAAARDAETFGPL